MRKRFLFGLGAVATAMVAFAVLSRPSDAQQQPSVGPAPLTKSDSSKLQGPRQPIFFRHDIHAGQLKMQCQYCHYTVGVSSEPGIPALSTCMGCHVLVTGKTKENAAEIKKLSTAWTKKEPVEWVRVHEVAKHAHFPHMRHIKALGPQACATCHGNVAQMSQVFKVNNVNNMGFCISCHIERKVSRDCSVCHY
jgi:hypothetical protein